MTNESLHAISQFVKYLGLVVATASSVWSATNDLRREDANHQRHLTKAGKIAIGVTVFGFAVSITSAAVGDRLASTAGRVASEKEAKLNREIILSSQPLKTVEIQWLFPALDEKTAALFHTATQGFEADEQTLLDLFDHNASDEFLEDDAILQQDRILTPALNLIGGANWTGQSTVALIALDDSASAVLPLGYLDLKQENDSGRLLVDAHQAAGIAPGIREASVDKDRYLPNNIPVQSRKLSSSDAGPNASSTDHSLRISWKLPSVDLSPAIDKVDSCVSLTAKLPDRIRILVLTRIQRLPFNPHRMTEAIVQLPWATQGNSDYTPAGLRGSQLTITTNDLHDMRGVYSMKMMDKDQLLARSSEGGITDYADVAVWTGSREDVSAGP